MKIDLHSHSTASDGALAPAEMLALAIAAELELYALTDHDTLEGFDVIAAMPKPASLSLVSGVEISTQWNGVGIHILGFDMDTDDGGIMRQFLAEQGRLRGERAERIAEKLAKKGFANCLEGALNINGGRRDNVGRVHFAQYLVQAGHCVSQNKAFDLYLGNGKVGDVKQTWPSIGEAVTAITQANGHAVLAHPMKYKLSTTKLKRFLDDFVGCGGSGIEYASPGNTIQQLTFLQRLAQDYDLAISGGSDFHLPGLAWCQLGRIPEMPASLPKIWEQFA